MAKRKKKIVKPILRIAVSLSIIISSIFIYVFNSKIDNKLFTPPTFAPLKDSACSVYFIDVGQGDSILINSDNKNVLIDAGTSKSEGNLIKFLKDKGVKKIDLLIPTHPDSDHIGGMDKIVNEFQIDKVIMQKLPDKIVPTTKTYTDLLMAISSKGLKITESKTGSSYSLGQGKLTIIGPQGEFDDTNNMSIVTKFQYGEFSFLFTGDMEKPAEKVLLNTNTNLKANFLKLGHHGSKTSTSVNFLKAVNPKACFVSVGEDNDYNHPSNDVMNLLKKYNIPVYRTDKSGSIACHIKDGKVDIEFE